MTAYLLAGALALAAGGALAQPVKCVDARGHVRYIDQSMMAQEKCEPVKAQANIVTTQPGAIAPRPPAEAKPGDSADAREAALQRAEANLAAARKALAEQEAIRTGDERNYARVQERLKPYQDAVEAAQRELDAAQRAAR